MRLSSMTLTPCTRVGSTRSPRVRICVLATRLCGAARALPGGAVPLASGGTGTLAESAWPQNAPSPNLERSARRARLASCGYEFACRGAERRLRPRFQ